MTEADKEIIERIKEEIEEEGQSLVIGDSYLHTPKSLYDEEKGWITSELDDRLSMIELDDDEEKEEYDKEKEKIETDFFSELEYSSRADYEGDYEGDNSGFILQTIGEHHGEHQYYDTIEACVLCFKEHYKMLARVDLYVKPHKEYNKVQ